jgi:hypothetical protein
MIICVILYMLFFETVLHSQSVSMHYWHGHILLGCESTSSE